MSPLYFGYAFTIVVALIITYIILRFAFDHKKGTMRFLKWLGIACLGVIAVFGVSYLIGIILMWIFPIG
jgi:hypothetical protein